MMKEEGIWKYASYFPAIDQQNRISIGEGNTPLIRSRRIGPELGLNNLYFKLESANPTGSYKDRIAALGVSWALEQGKEACIGTTSGNAGAAIAAYAAKAGLPYHLLVLEHIVEEKLQQALVYGPDIKKIQGFGEYEQVGNQVFEYIINESAKKNWEVLITAFQFNPIAMLGVSTISFELWHQLGNRAPDAIFVPVGGGGLFTGISLGFEQLSGGGTREDKLRSTSIVAVQSEGCANIVKAWREGLAVPVSGDSASQISGLQVPNPPDGKQVLDVLNRGNGWGHTVHDQDVWRWQETLAVQEGIFCEAAAAISLAGVEQSIQEGRLDDPDQMIVCIISGAGWKDGSRMRELTKKNPEVGIYTIESIADSVK